MGIRSRLACIGVVSSALLGGGAYLTNSGLVGSSAAQAAEHEHHPHLHAAIHELKEARHELKTADHDFGGHREEAVKAIDVAIEQLETAVKFDRH